MRSSAVGSRVLWCRLRHHRMHAIAELLQLPLAGPVAPQAGPLNCGRPNGRGSTWQRQEAMTANLSLERWNHHRDASTADALAGPAPEAAPEPSPERGEQGERQVNSP